MPTFSESRSIFRRYDMLRDSDGARFGGTPGKIVFTRRITSVLKLTVFYDRRKKGRFSSGAGFGVWAPLAHSSRCHCRVDQWRAQEFSEGRGLENKLVGLKNKLCALLTVLKHSCLLMTIMHLYKNDVYDHCNCC